MEDKERITKALDAFGIKPRDDEWSQAEDGLTAQLGRWHTLVDDEDRGLYGGDEGVLTANVVGAAEYGNQRVCVTFTPDGNDPNSGPEVVPFDDVEPMD